ncbi:MAG: hypothetical protein HY581_05030 [Nitrospirae bacterium]|nr:hypothetical protein [Nitrospirota bacterium]
MKALHLTAQSPSAWANGCCALVVCTLITMWSAACTTPGAVAPSTMPVTGKYVELGAAEESSSCGYTILFIPVKNPKPVAMVIEEMIKGRGGDALIEVASSSSTTFYLFGVANCVQVRGKVVNFSK